MGHETDWRVSLVHRPFERILLARIECLNVLVVESLFIDLDARAKQQQLRKLLDCKTNGIGCRFEAAISDLLRALAIAPRIQFGWCIVVKTGHVPSRLLADANCLEQLVICGVPKVCFTEVKHFLFEWMDSG